MQRVRDFLTNQRACISKNHNEDECTPVVRFEIIGCLDAFDQPA